LHGPTGQDVVEGGLHQGAIGFGVSCVRLELNDILRDAGGVTAIRRGAACREGERVPGPRRA